MDIFSILPREQHDFRYQVDATFLDAVRNHASQEYGEYTSLAITEAIVLSAVSLLLETYPDVFRRQA